MKLKHLVYAFIFSMGCLVISLIYAPAKSAAYMERGYNAVGGEVFLWILPFALVIAVDTFIGWRKLDK